MDKDKVLILNFGNTLDQTILSALSNVGYELDVVRDFLQGLYTLSCNDYQVVIINDGPIGIGWFACYQIRELTDIPSIVISSDLSQQTLVRTLNAGADYFLTKPLDSSELVARIDALLRRNNLNKELSIRRARIIALSRLN